MMSLYDDVQCADCGRSVCKRHASQFRKTKVGRQHPHLQQMDGSYLCNDCFTRYEKDLVRMASIPNELKAQVIQWCSGGLDFDELANKVASVFTETEGMEPGDVIHCLEDEGFLEETDHTVSVVKLGHDAPAESVEEQMCAVYDLAIQRGYIDAAIEIRGRLQKL